MPAPRRAAREALEKVSGTPIFRYNGARRHTYPRSTIMANLTRFTPFDDSFDELLRGFFRASDGV